MKKSSLFLVWMSFWNWSVGELFSVRFERSGQVLEEGGRKDKRS